MNYTESGSRIVKLLEPILSIREVPVDIYIYSSGAAFDLLNNAVGGTHCAFSMSVRHSFL